MTPMRNAPTDADLQDLLAEARQAVVEIQRLQERKARFARSTDEMPSMTDGPQVTVSIAWINRMIDFFEGVDPSLETGS